MATIEETAQRVLEAISWDERVARIRLVPSRHGTDEHGDIYARIAEQAYVPHLGADFAYVHADEFYELDHFQHSYDLAESATAGFEEISADALTAVLQAAPQALLALRTISGLARKEFAATTAIVAAPLGLAALTEAKVNSMERFGSSTTQAQARVAAEALAQLMAGTLFPAPPGDLRSKQENPTPDTGGAAFENSRHAVCPTPPSSTSATTAGPSASSSTPLPPGAVTSSRTRSRRCSSSTACPTSTPDPTTKQRSQRASSDGDPRP